MVPNGPKRRDVLPRCLFIIGTYWTVTVPKAEMSGARDLVQRAREITQPLREFIPFTENGVWLPEPAWAPALGTLHPLLASADTHTHAHTLLPYRPIDKYIIFKRNKKVIQSPKQPGITWLYHFENRKKKLRFKAVTLRVTLKSLVK